MLSMERVERIGRSVILYDASLVNHPCEAWFECSHWSTAQEAAGGRGGTLFVHHEGQDWVLRHYLRGGAVARFCTDGFFWTGADRTRSFAEWRLLDHMRRCSLPVPRPVAARFVRSGAGYRADLITMRLASVNSLAEHLKSGQLTAALWRAVGACIARFHQAHICHADLNAHNIQIGANGTIYLLDFDRGRVRAPGNWQQRNLERLQRSLCKVGGGRGGFSGDGGWAALLAGYREGCSTEERGVR